ncbi:TIGR02678 family protein [Micromonospora antibiotica]|uniref:TIGR02678 family protein n=1 Tax=Micromonospora antibiotica TaxID=2807623 RepID=A0ABS3V6J7_9ACTN|nr:TIGR02678 family protein [Micromonospora antibiotica]MBO4161223.1 TIGR02678 family protein [Micromonospora antibiotica]
MSSTTSAGAKAWRQRRAAEPETAAETAAVLRLLMVQPWLVAGRDDTAIATVRRNEEAVREVLGRLGWVLVVDRDFVRLRKSPPVRRDAWAADGPGPLTCSWFFLLVAAAESMAPRVSIGQLVSAARGAAAEAEVPTPDDMPQRHAILAAVKMLERRGVVESLDGDLNQFLRDDDPPVLLAVHHHRLVHVIANFSTADPVLDPVGWLEQVEREADPARRMRRRLVDDTAVYASDLDADEADWLSRRVRGDDGLPLAEAFGLHLERRAEGAAFVVPTESFRSRDALGDCPFPSGGTVAHAAVLLCDVAEAHGVVDADRPGWRGMHAADVTAHLTSFSQRYAGQGWAAEHVANPAGLAAEIVTLLNGANLLRVEAGTWWFSPAAGRWEPPPPPRRDSRRPSGKSAATAHQQDIPVLGEELDGGR